jgi:hypothetical protein
MAGHRLHRRDPAVVDGLDHQRVDLALHLARCRSPGSGSSIPSLALLCGPAAFPYR